MTPYASDAHATSLWAELRAQLRDRVGIIVNVHRTLGRDPTWEDVASA